MTKEHSFASWTRALVEGAVIVGSILLAFGINAWWDSRKEAVRTTELIAELRADFQSTTLLLDQADRYGKAVSGRSKGLMMVAASDSGGPSADSIRILAGALSEEIAFTPAVSHYNAAVATGEIRLLKSDSLMVFLNRFDEGLRRFEQHSELSGHLFYSGAVQDLRRQFGGLAYMTSGDVRAITSRIRSPGVRAAVEPIFILQLNIVEALEQMLAASRLILGELDVLSKT